MKKLEGKVKNNQRHINRLNTRHNLWITFPERKTSWYVSPPRKGETIMRVGPDPTAVRGGESGYPTAMSNSLITLSQSISQSKFGESIVPFMHALATTKLAEESEQVGGDVDPKWVGLFDEVKESLHEIAGLDLGYKYDEASNSVRASVDDRILVCGEMSEGQLTLIDVVLRSV